MDVESIFHVNALPIFREYGFEFEIMADGRHCAQTSPNIFLSLSILDEVALKYGTAVLNVETGNEVIPLIIRLPNALPNSES